MSTDHDNTKKPDALELGINDVKESHPLNAENFPHCYFSPRSEKWIVRNTIQNLEYFMKYHRINARLNEMSYLVEVELNSRTEFSAKNHDHFVVIKSLLAESGLDKTLNVNDYATQIAIKNLYHPTRDWITSKPLTTTGNIKRIVAALKPANPLLAEILLTTWMVSGIKAWFHPKGVAAQGNLVLCGKTGTRKTSFIKSLLPDDMILEGHVLKTSKDGNKITALKYAITEMGEISASIKASGNDELKGFFTTQVDSIRVPYGKIDTVKPRRTIFAGTVNDARFLTDETGNRRYWIIDVTDVIDTDHGVDIQQLWAEALHLYNMGSPCFLTPEQEAMVTGANKSHEVENLMEELLLTQYDWEATRNRFLNCAEIMLELNEPLGNTKTEASMRRALRTLENNDKNLTIKRTGGGLVYEMPRLSFNKSNRLYL